MDLEAELERMAQALADDWDELLARALVQDPEADRQEVFEYWVIRQLAALVMENRRLRRNPFEDAGM